MNEDQLQHLLNVSYKELTHEQREEFKDYFTNEEEFQNVKDLFIGIQSLDSSSINPDENIKNNLDKEFFEIYRKETIFRKFILFLFPPTKPLFMKPAFQIGIASLLIVFGVSYWNSLQTFDYNDQNQVVLARNNEKLKEDLKSTKSNDTMKLLELQKNKDEELKEEGIHIAENSEIKTIENFREDIALSTDVSLSSGLRSEDSEIVFSEELDNVLLAESVEDETNSINHEEVYSISENIEVLNLLYATY